MIREFYLFFLVLITLISCSRERTTRQVRITYTNGSVFIEGAYSTFKRKTVKVGLWKEYYPTGQLKSIVRYDEKGEIEEGKKYDEVGSMSLSIITNDNSSMVQYYENGNVIRDVIHTTNRLVDDEGEEYESRESKFRVYFSNGLLNREYVEIDGKIEGDVRVYDESGSLIGIYTCEHGIILK